jgi:hypothetical protein
MKLQEFDNRALGRARTWLGRLLKYAVLSAFLVFVTPRLTTWIPLTFPFAHPEQDACTFGPVTNPEYREMLATARSIQRWTWLGSKSEDQLLKQFSEVSGNNPSPYVKIAAMHAVLRALGADFRNVGQFSDGMFDRVSKKGGAIQYNYALPVPRIGALSGWPGDAWFIGGLKGPQSPTDVVAHTKQRQGQVYFVVWYPMPIIDRIPDVLGRGEFSCPSVPPRELEEYFTGGPQP